MAPEKNSEQPFDERAKTFYTHYFESQQIRAGRQFEVSPVGVRLIS